MLSRYVNHFDLVHVILWVQTTGLDLGVRHRFCGESVHLGEAGAQSGVLYRRFLRPSHSR